MIIKISKEFGRLSEQRKKLQVFTELADIKLNQTEMRNKIIETHTHTHTHTLQRINSRSYDTEVWTSELKHRVI